VRLPAADAPLPGADATEPAAAPRRGAGRVLVVDDNADAAEMLEVLLAEVGYEVRIALDAAAALRLCEAFTPDVALLDIGLPGISGYELARTLRRGPLGPGLRLVALTGYGSEKDRAQALDAGFDEHLVKPVAIDTLLALLQRLTRSPERPRA
jgi:CheY-like chemotaxis protein